MGKQKGIDSSHQIKKSARISPKTELYTGDDFHTRDNFKTEQKEKILEKNKNKNNGYYTCEECGFSNTNKNYATFQGKRIGDGGFQVDHIKPASSGGLAKSKNSSVLCGTCNTSKGNRSIVQKKGINKYRALDGKSIVKDYKRKP
jgi:5-methylcytosine-specific restriction endonuclease McrA